MIFFLNLSPTRCCEVCADANAVYFTVLQWIMNVCSVFETLKIQLLGKCILILLLL